MCACACSFKVPRAFVPVDALPRNALGKVQKHLLPVDIGMSPAVASLIALLVAIALSLTSRVNVGVVAMVFAWVIGTTLAGLKPDQVAAGFPSSLFLALTGVSLLFALAEMNGTLERLANRAVLLAKGNARVIPIVFFVIAFVLSSIGPARSRRSRC